MFIITFIIFSIGLYIESIRGNFIVGNDGFIEISLNGNFFGNFVAPCDEYVYYKVYMVHNCLDLTIAGSKYNS